MKERCDLDYLMKQFDGNMTLEKANEFSDTFLSYFKNISEKIEFVTTEINKCIKELEE